ncbi:hypothetical protein [Peterkaempfera bronchialis]|uniref:hypothetical protein n=1 Tax=Peterkaempfera bronchialis TaxID=2126346 RepID=UPI003C2C95BC
MTSLAGAALPIAVGALVPGPSWTVAVLAVAALTGLGGALARTIAGPPIRWAASRSPGAAPTGHRREPGWRHGTDIHKTE